MAPHSSERAAFLPCTYSLTCTTCSLNYDDNCVAGHKFPVLGKALAGAGEGGV